MEGSRDGSPAMFPRISPSTLTTTWGDDDSDLCTNDAYGDPAIDMTPVFSQEAYDNELTSECHINYKATIAMRDNAAYYSNSQSVNEHEL